MVVPKFFTLIFLAALCLISSAEVHQLVGKYVQGLDALPDLDVESLAERLNLPLEQFHRLAGGFGDKVDVVGGLDVKKSCYVALVANISVGTPSQELSVLLQYWAGNSINLLGDRRKGVVATDHFNSSASSTYESRNQSHWVLGGRSYLGSDNIQIGSADLTNVTLNVIESRLFSFARQLTGVTISGTVGLVPSNPGSNGTSFVEEVVDQLDEPVVTLASGETGISGNGTARITLGGLDSANCNDDFVYAPVALSVLTKAVNVSSASAIAANGTVLNTLALNASLVVTPTLQVVVVSRRVQQLIVNATQAEYNSTLGVYTVDCEQQQGADSGKLAVNIGNAEGENAVVLSGRDLVARVNDICYLNIVRGFGDNSRDFIVVGSRFLTNHCITQRIDDRTLGIATSKSA